jgi:transcriptional regulator with XRE-family HTH domain
MGSDVSKNAAPPPPADRGGAAGDVTGLVCRRVKQLRAQCGWSLEELSSVCGVSRSMLSQIERDQANPTLAVTLRIAQAFGLSIGELVDASVSSASIEVIRSDDTTYHYRSDRECCLRTLSPLHLEKDVEFYELRLNAGSELRSAAHFEGTREFLTVQKGQLRVESAEATVKLGPGDSANYRADVAHAIVNVGRGEAVVFLVVIYA